jgi:Protein of unknown function (DUF2723)
VTRAQLLAAFGVTALGLVLWLPLVQTGSQGADSSEWVLTALTGSLAHPPGYPLWSWLCEQAWSVAAILGANNPYRVLGTLNCVLQAVAAGAWVLALSTLGAPLAAAVVAMISWLLLPSTAMVSTYVEVFALHHLLAAILVTWCARWWLVRRQQTVLWLFALGVWCGFSFAHHQTIVLWAPLVAASAWVSSTNRRGPSVLCFAVGIGVGLLPYLHLFQRHLAAPGLSMTPLTTWIDLKAVVLRESYGTFAFGADRDRQAYAALQWLSEVPFALIAVLGLGALCLRRARLDMVLLLVVALHVCFMMALKVSDDQSLAQVSERFFPLAWLGILATVAALSQRLSRWSPLALVVPLVLLPSTREHGDAATDVFLHDMREQLVARASPNSIIIVHCDEDYFGISAEAARQQKAIIALAISDIDSDRLPRRLRTMGLSMPPLSTRRERMRWLADAGVSVLSIMHPTEGFEPDAHPLLFHPGVRWQLGPPTAEQTRDATMEWCDRLPPTLLHPPQRPSARKMATLALHPMRSFANYPNIVAALSVGDLAEARRLCVATASSAR